jgi:leader peptidase (prepilin peptidase)/N-methyltransferase
MPEQSPQLQHLMDLNFQFFAFVVGLCLGSFLNVVIARIPEGISIVQPRSRCPKCHKTITWNDNIPLVSWILLGGKCRSCHTSISPRYPIVELLTGLLTLALARRFGMTPIAFGYLVFIGVLIAVAYIDLDHWIVPLDLVLGGTVVGVLSSFVNPDLHWWESILGAVVGFGAFALLAAVGTYVFKKPALGKGDWYLLAMIGAFLGVKALLPVILVASLLGSIVGVILLGLGRGEPGPQLAVAGAGASGVEAAVQEAPTTENEAHKQATSVEPATEPAASTDAPPNSEVPAATDVVHPDEDDENWVPPKNSVPFGPFLALGAMAQLFAGDWLHDSYFRLISSMSR